MPKAEVAPGLPGFPTPEGARWLAPEKEVMGGEKIGRGGGAGPGLEEGGFGRLTAKGVSAGAGAKTAVVNVRVPLEGPRAQPAATGGPMREGRGGVAAVACFGAGRPDRARGAPRGLAAT